MFNKDLLTWCRESHFKEQHMNPTPLLNIIDEKEEYEVEEVRCYESKLKGLSNETTLVLSNTRELDRVPKTK